MTREISFTSLSISLVVTKRGVLVFSEIKLLASITVGAPIEITGTPNVFSFKAAREF